MALQSARNLAPAVDRVLCILRPDDHALREILASEGFATVPNPDAAQGISTSLRAGISASPPKTLGWLIALGDMPFLQPQTCRQVATTLRQQGGIVVPTYHGQPGHPVAFAQDFRAELLALRGDQGARPVVRRHLEQRRLIAVEDEGVLTDVDTREDWMRAEREINA